MIFKKPTLPQPTTCHVCGTSAAEFICHICKTERPAYAALKRITEKQEPKPADVVRRMYAEAI